MFAKLYKDVGASNKSQAYKSFMILIALSIALLVLNYCIDRLENYIGPCFRTYAKSSLVKHVLTSNQDKYKFILTLYLLNIKKNKEEIKKNTE